MKVNDLYPGMSIKCRIQGEDDIAIDNVGFIHHEENGDVKIYSLFYVNDKKVVIGFRHGDELINIFNNRPTFILTPEN